MVSPRAHRLDGIPVVPSLPFVGALPSLVGPEGPLENLCRLVMRHAREGVVAVPLPGGSTKVFVCDVSLAEEVLDDRTWEKAIDPLLESARRLVGNGLFTADGDDPAWGAAHRILAPAFSASAMGRYVPEFVDVVNGVVGRWASTGEPVDVCSDMTRLTLDTIARVGFGQRMFSADVGRRDPFVDAFAYAMDEVITKPLRPGFPRLYELYRSAKFARARRTTFARVDRVVEGRRASPRASWPDDLLTRMLADEDPRTGVRLGHENVRFQVLTFLLAGHETTANLLSFALHYVARDPLLADRLRREADLVLGTHPIDLERARRLDLTSRVLDETLRLHPPAPFFMRKPRSATRLGGRHPMGPSDSVAVLLPALHRNPAIWPDPDRFDPDRFLPDVVRARPAHVYRPFGHGKRICTGRNFALTEATIALASIVRALDLEDPGPLRVRSVPVPKPLGFRLRVRPRRSVLASHGRGVDHQARG